MQTDTPQNPTLADLATPREKLTGAYLEASAALHAAIAAFNATDAALDAARDAFNAADAALDAAYHGIPLHRRQT